MEMKMLPDLLNIFSICSYLRSSFLIHQAEGIGMCTFLSKFSTHEAAPHADDLLLNCHNVPDSRLLLECNSCYDIECSILSDVFD
ncbi:hypothetical protein scyTo_0016154 [Scyliorhinus torazame]|uniref:Uncharacterized protein n=1 Tax=Scyliorhinus torazame TaxID=75743 RepID=A0A401Q4K1_SCYTO|nr:hypothetical protein [Scyliorhinus torazame]